jgi:hypothetical protein
MISVNSHAELSTLRFRKKWNFGTATDGPEKCYSTRRVVSMTGGSRFGDDALRAGSATRSSIMLAGE